MSINTTANEEIVISEKLSSFPDKAKPYGYGFLPIRGPTDAATANYLSVVNIRELILSRHLGANAHSHVSDLRRVAIMFDAAHAANTPTWFQHSANLGFPSHALAKFATHQLRSAQIALIAGDVTAFQDAVDAMHDEAVVEMLENYIALARGSTIEKEKGFAFLACSGGLIQNLKIGVTEECLTKYMRDRDKSSPAQEGRWGVVGAWMVHDVAHAKDTLRSLDSINPGGAMGKRLKVWQRAKAVHSEFEARLIASENLVISPWHVNDEAAYDRLALRSARPPTASNQSLAAFR